MGIAYCMLVYKDPEQVLRLIERLYSPSDYFYIHKDNRVPSEEWKKVFTEFTKRSNCRFVSKHATAWASFKCIEARLDAMDYHRKLDYDYFVNLTGQCYPIKPMKAIKEYLGGRSVAHIEHFSLPSSVWARGGLDRINYRWFRFRGRNIRVPRLTKNLPYNMQPYGGSAWFCLPKRHVDYVLDFVSQNPKILSFYKHSHMPEEMFFQTIIMNSPLKDEVVNKDEWYIDWSRAKGGHPPVLTKADLPLLLASGKLFARKFDVTVDSEVLDLIDKESAA